MSVSAQLPSRVCVPNIGPRGRRRRFIGGAVWLVAGFIYAVVLTRRGATGLWWVTLIVPFLCAALGYFQARERT
jgi:hypothetical protein